MVLGARTSRPHSGRSTLRFFEILARNNFSRFALSADGPSALPSRKVRHYRSPLPPLDQVRTGSGSDLVRAATGHQIMIKTHGLTHISLAAFVYVADPEGYEIEIWYE
jgi:hypothetical protein